MMKKKKTEAVIDVARETADMLGTALANFYDRMWMDSASANFMSPWGKIVGYRKVRVPVYLEVTVPVIERHYSDDDDYGSGEYEGLLISTRKIRLFRIGTKIEKEPIYEKPKGKGSTMKFKRYSSLLPTQPNEENNL